MKMFKDYNDLQVCCALRKYFTDTKRRENFLYFLVHI